MANIITPWHYTANDGTVYVTGINGEVASQLGAASLPKIGGTVATASSTALPLPSSVKPRRAYLKNALGVGRYVTIMTQTAELNTPGTTLNLEDSDGVETVFTVRKVHAEDFGRSRI